MKNTIVTAIYYSSPMSRMGGRAYTFDHYVAPFRNFLNLNCNIVVYSHESEMGKIKNFFEEYKFEDYKLINFDLNSYHNSDKIYELKEKSGLINKDGLTPGVSCMANDRNHHLCLLKPYFLKHTIESNFFNSKKYYWVDAGLFHHGIFPETHGGIERLTKINESNYWPIHENNICNPSLLDRLESKNKTEIIFLGIDGYYGAPPHFQKYSEGNFKLTHIVGGLFGGDKDIMLEFYNDFDKISTNVLNDNILTLEEEIISIMYSLKYNKYNYIPFKSWYHDIPTAPNYFGLSSDTESFYKIFI